jgi:recombination associated protein RdgC
VGAGSIAAADAAISLLIELLPGVVLRLVNLSSARAMSAWLLGKEAPGLFTIDRECELKQPDSEKSTVRYARHTLDIDEVGEHIRRGKLPTKLAMTWNGRVSFTLTEATTLRGLKLLDVVLEGGHTESVRDDAFDADVAITTGELRVLIADLISAIEETTNEPAQEAA